MHIKLKKRKIKKKSVCKKCFEDNYENGTEVISEKDYYG